MRGTLAVNYPDSENQIAGAGKRFDHSFETDGLRGDQRKVVVSPDRSCSHCPARELEGHRRISRYLVRAKAQMATVACQGAEVWVEVVP